MRAFLDEEADHREVEYFHGLEQIQGYEMHGYEIYGHETLAAARLMERP